MNIDPEAARKEFEADSFTEMKISSRHAVRTMLIPMHSDHKDHFDRMILAQALEEGATLVTGDEKMAQYSYPNILLI